MSLMVPFLFTYVYVYIHSCLYILSNIQIIIIIVAMAYGIIFISYIIYTYISTLRNSGGSGL